MRLNGGEVAEPMGYLEGGCGLEPRNLPWASCQPCDHIGRWDPPPVGEAARTRRQPEGACAIPVKRLAAALSPPSSIPPPTHLPGWQA